jgi:hypothetical protein
MAGGNREGARVGLDCVKGTDRSRRYSLQSFSANLQKSTAIVESSRDSRRRKSHGPLSYVGTFTLGIQCFECFAAENPEKTAVSCWCVRAVGHNHTSTTCGSSSGGRFNWIKPGYKLRKRFRTSLSDLELIDSLLGL